MTWTVGNEGKTVTIEVNGEEYDVEVTSPNELVEKIKEVARQQGIKKFEVLDEDGDYLTPSSIQENFSDISKVIIQRKDEAGY